MYFKHYKVLIGMVDNNIEAVKVIGRREMNMDGNMKKMVYESDSGYRYRPYFNDAKELFGICFWIHCRKASDNKQK